MAAGREVMVVAGRWWWLLREFLRAWCSKQQLIQLPACGDGGVCGGGGKSLEHGVLNITCTTCDDGGGGISLEHGVLNITCTTCLSVCLPVCLSVWM